MTTISTSPKQRLLNTSHALSGISFLVLLVILMLKPLTPLIAIVAVVFLGIAVMTAVHHAEVIAVKMGPTLGALVLALSVTVIEVGLIISMMMNDSPDSTVIARDTVFSAVIIVTNGIMGFCFLLGGIRHRELTYNVGGTSSLMAVLAILSALTMVLPNFTVSSPGPTYSNSQLIFASIACILMYGMLVLAQTKTLKEYFEPEVPLEDPHAVHQIPSKRLTWLSFGCLVISLIVVIGLAKSLSPSIEAGIIAVGAPRSVVGIVIALLVLLPEAFAAIAAARINQLQTSLNLSLGSGVASIALTIPVVSIFSILTGRHLTLGLDQMGIAFLVLTFFTGSFTMGMGRGTSLQGGIHLILLLSFLAFSFMP